MIQIRSGVFETNSSSSHSICVRNDKTTFNVDADNICDNLLNGRGVWRIHEEDVSFGRSPFRYLSKFSEKVCYALANGIKVDTLKNIVQKYVPEFTGFDFTFSSKYYPTGYTDDNILPRWLTTNNVHLEDFLTSEKYFVICDGDEYCIFSDMIKSNIISDKVEHGYSEEDLE